MSMTPHITLDPRRYAICLIDDASYYDLPLVPFCVLGQKGSLLSVVVEKSEAESSGLPCRTEWARIALEGGNATPGTSGIAALIACLGSTGIASQIIAGYNQTSCLVFWEQRFEALALLRTVFSRGVRLPALASAA